MRVSRNSSDGLRSMETIQALLEKNQLKLQNYVDAKTRLERAIEKNFHEIEGMNGKIHTVEIQIERLVQEAATRDLHERTKRELALIKEDAGSIYEMP